MSNPTAWTSGVPKSTGDRVSAAEFNALDAGQQNALCRTGVTPLTGNSSVQGNGHQFSIETDDVAGSKLIITIGDSDCEIQENGTGKLKLTAPPKLLGASVSMVAAPEAMFATTDFVRGITAYVSQATSACQLAFKLLLPVGVTVTAVSVGYVGAGGHGALPAVMPSITVSHTAFATNGSTSLGSASDTSGSVAAFELYHLITKSGLSYTVAAGDVMTVLVTSESGANSVASANAYPFVRVTFTRTSMETFG